MIARHISGKEDLLVRSGMGSTEVVLECQF